ncbi:class D beta-lactamase [Limnoraphis robusta]|uniref:Beta-lactamase n=1 Tax=Limnoraphis robusta CCNP1315 TaxID=3110306 RepID=A0ABU5U3N0_9CYAN|nr:class D beta-lactamase [Limnoraphis robusta]MEA5499941.1 class D beta-lactamase [Limnoraphis robusta BA-68 BA1]MEA5521502.1 class D beta-lactamase [Limnoraphis robusta CCNP1315]MEA5543954.1 class D beta-lactamase [Limnoraphis robusta CCNP1324]
MGRIFSFLSYFLVSACCAIFLNKPVQGSLSFESTVSQVSQQFGDAQPNFSKHFDELNIEGSIIISDLNQNLIYQHNLERNTTAFLPASTFKIPNSLIALETGVIESDISVLTWDGIERSFPEWNRDLNMRSAFSVSAVWFYQVLARRIGYKRMQQWITQIGYGNQNIGSAEEIDTFWLDGEIRITPQEQIQFLQRLYNNDLPFSEETIATVKDIMIVEQTPDYTIRAKTGWAGVARIGWYVGYVEQNGNVYFFATNLDIQDQSALGARKEITRRCLMDLGLL